MEAAANLMVDQVQQQQQSSPPLEILPFARSYQVEALEKAIKQNTIVFLETGSGKTLIAIMLLRSYSHFLRLPSPYKAVFLVPTVVLTAQQSEVVRTFTNLKVGTYSGEMGLNLWDADTWKEELDKHEVLVMTPRVLLNALRHNFIRLGLIKVLIFDECHNASRDHPYAQIMKEFYHPRLHNSEVPRIFGMTASLVKAKASDYWGKIQQLENILNSKVYTCANQSVLADCISFPAAKFKFYEQSIPPFSEDVRYKLSELVTKQICSLKETSVKESTKKSCHKKLQCLASTFDYCVNELGLWLALKAVESYSSVETDDSHHWNSNGLSKTVMDRFNLDVQMLFLSYFPSAWSVSDDIEANTKAGFLSKKVTSLLESLREYRDTRDLRCIVFVERVVTAIALHSFLNELLHKDCEWVTKYVAGNNHALQSQSRIDQKKIIQEFREGKANIIVASSVLEEGLDVQSCNLVIRFDPSSNICSFIQSRGRARVKNSEFVLMVKSGDDSALAQAKMYLASIETMRSESLRHSSLPCEPIQLSSSDQMIYRVERTGAVVNLSYSVSLIHFYCSRLPSDEYFKPSPRFIVDKDSDSCTLQFPKSCPLQSVTVKGCDKLSKQITCLEACKKFHQMGALTDNLVPDTMEEANVEELDNAEESYNDEQPLYFPPELVSNCAIGQDSLFYHGYLLELETSFDYSVPVHNVILALNTKLDQDIGSTLENIRVNRGSMDVKLKYLGKAEFTHQRVILSRMFQAVVFTALVDHSFDKINKAIDDVKMSCDCARLDYLILPCTGSSNTSPTIDWRYIRSVLFHRQDISKCHENCSLPLGSAQIHTKNGLVCRCMLKNCLVYTPHNGRMYHVSGFLNNMNINSDMVMDERKEDVMTYKDYFKNKHGIDLCFENEVMFSAKPMFRLQNFLLRCGQRKRKGSEYTYCELPPELCYVIMAPVSVNTFHTFSLVPLIMHRLESMLIAASLQRVYAEQCTQNVVLIPTMKILEAITTEKCHEAFHLESLETLGDSFLKYAVSQLLFKRHQNHHEGLLSLKREKIISNATLCKLGCKRKIPGFIRDRVFEPKDWCIAGDPKKDHLFEEEWVTSAKSMHKIGTQRLKGKRVADVVEALIGAFLSSGGEVAALSFMNWLGIEVDFSYIPYNREFQVDAATYVNINHLQSLLKYSFRDPSLLVEALTHGSYMMPEIPRCYQRLEFLGDSVLDHLITLHLFSKHPGLSPGLLTEMRSASVNNDCYAYSSIRVELHKHILHASGDLHRDIGATLCSCEELLAESAFGWEFDIRFPKVLADVVESLAGAIFVDSGYDKNVVFRSLKPLLEPLVTPETLKIHPVQELQLLCQKHHFVIQKPVVCRQLDGSVSYTLEVEAKGSVHSDTCTAADKKLGQKIASRAILKSLKDSLLGMSAADKKLVLPFKEKGVVHQG